MLKIEWRDAYKIDSGVIDKEHKQLIAMANQVFALIDPSSQRAEIIELVKALYKYMEFHFDHEEKLMQEAAAPHLAEHAQRHKRIIQSMNQALLSQEDITQYAAQLRYLMVDWVVRHIVEEDRKITQYLVASTN